MKTIIYTSFPCLVKLGDIQETISQNENLVIEEDFDTLIIYPTEKGRISFEININEHESSFYRIIERGGKRLVFLLDGLYAENAEVYTLNYNGTKSKIEVYKEKVIFSGKDGKKIIHLNQKYSSYKYGNIKFIDYCLLSNVSGDNTLLAYNAQKNTAKVFSASEITQENDGFIINNSDFGYQSINQQLYIDEEGLKIRKKDFVSASMLSPEETIAYQFLNSIKYGDYSRSMSMLSQDLQNRIDAAALKEYFGNISYFYMLDPTSAYAISNDKNVIFEFSIKDRKICEISSE